MVKCFFSIAVFDEYYPSRNRFDKMLSSLENIHSKIIFRSYLEIRFIYLAIIENIFCYLFGVIGMKIITMKKEASVVEMGGLIARSDVWTLWNNESKVRKQNSETFPMEKDKIAKNTGVTSASLGYPKVEEEGCRSSDVIFGQE